jgi:hypothetical protein
VKRLSGCHETGLFSYGVFLSESRITTTATAPYRAALRSGTSHHRVYASEYSWAGDVWHALPETTQRETH